MAEMTTPAWVPRKRRGAEFFLTVLASLAGRTQDHAEGIAAFSEKREPRFLGR